MATKKQHNNYWPFEDHAITNLFLDQKNIRLPISGATQSALIQDLFSNEEAFELVKSFVQNNIFPDEFPIVVKENGKLIVIEGNRRIAALKALNQPDLVPAFRDRLKAFNNIKLTKIKVVIAPSREYALKHIANKHTINYRRPWKPLRQAYFYKSQLDNGKTIEMIKADYPDHDITKFIKMLEMHHIAKSLSLSDSNVLEKIHDERRFPITNLERMYDSIYVQEALGFSFDDNGKIIGKIDKNEFIKGYKKLVEDVGTGQIDSRKTNTASLIQKYITTLPDEYKPNIKKKANFYTKDFKETKLVISPPNNRSTPTPSGLFHSTHLPYKLKNTALRFLYDELKDINVKKFPNAAHDLLKSFLECALIVFFKQVGEYDYIKKTDQHNPKLGEMLSHIINRKSKFITDSNIIEVVKQIKTDYDSPYSIERMNMTNHNENWNSSEKDVRVAWGKIESLFKIILNPITNDANSK